jgi:hypothetical protein
VTSSSRHVYNIVGCPSLPQRCVRAFFSQRFQKIAEMVSQSVEKFQVRREFFLPNFENKSSLGRCSRCAPPTSAPPLRLLVIRAICTHAYRALSPRSLMDVARDAWAVSVLTRYIAARSLHSGVAHTGRDKSVGRKNITTCGACGQTVQVALVSPHGPGIRRTLTSTV